MHYLYTWYTPTSLITRSSNTGSVYFTPIVSHTVKNILTIIVLICTCFFFSFSFSQLLLLHVSLLHLSSFLLFYLFHCLSLLMSFFILYVVYFFQLSLLILIKIVFTSSLSFTYFSILVTCLSFLIAGWYWATPSVCGIWRMLPWSISSSNAFPSWLFSYLVLLQSVSILSIIKLFAIARLQE